MRSHSPVSTAKKKKKKEKKDLSISIQSSTAVAHQDGQRLPQDPELPPAEVVPVVSPPSLKEVQQAVREASEQVEGRGAEEVLKELLERVVEAALGQAEAGNEAKANVVQEAVEEDSLGTESKESEAEAEVLEEAVENENMGDKEEDTGVKEKQEVAEADALEDVAEEGKGVVEAEGETAAGSVEKTTAGVETGVREAEGVEVIDESQGSEEEVVEGAVAALEETGGDFAIEKAGEDSEDELVLSEEKGAGETEIQEAEEAPAAVEMAVIGQTDQETVEESEPWLGEADVEQIGHDGAREEAPGDETQVDETEGEEIVVPSDNYEIEATQSVVEEPVEGEEKEENIVKDPEGLEGEDGYLVEGGTAEEKEAEGADVGEVTGDEIEGESVIKEESVALVNEESVQKAGEEEQTAVETSNGGEKEDEEVPVISGPEPGDGEEAFVEQSPENQAPSPNPSVSEVEPGENTPDEEKSDHGNEIITTTDDLLPQEPAVAQPTLDHFVNGVLGEQPEAQGEEPGEANELVEDTAGTIETNELGLEAWKIGAISAAVFLVLETVVIIIYILKCRNKNSTPARQRACEEGCVEPEAATGGDCSDDTLPAGNGDTQQYVHTSQYLY
ncbi:neurofilament medium polypeptide [Acanthochromis polyacanthus]|uniref:neurofilament medium polypeptide n=1 Tax=Acanthochromis polyacanthus TaxID=80966 RepID=UPI0022348E39|nr:neurofilament medium polypeptide [Acanthochromis polyacanthus]